MHCNTLTADDIGSISAAQTICRFPLLREERGLLSRVRGKIETESGHYSLSLSPGWTNF